MDAGRERVWQQQIVGIEKNQVGSSAGADSGVASGGDALIRLAYITDFGKASDNLARLIFRTIVDHNDLEVAIGLPADALDGFADEVRVVVGGNDDRY